MKNVNLIAVCLFVCLIFIGGNALWLESFGNADRHLQ